MAAPESAQPPPDLETTVDLFNAVRESLTVRSFPNEVALPITHFTFATWFAAHLPYAPCLLITGPRLEACFLLELLECLVCHPLPLGPLTREFFFSIPMDLQPTLLIDHERMGRSTWDLVLASNRRNAYVPRKDGLLNIYCAKAVYCGTEASDRILDDSALEINLSPFRGRLPVLDADDKQQMAVEFQPRMQAYRERNLVQVRGSRFDVPEFTSAIRILSRTLGAPIVDAPELQAGLRSLLWPYQENAQASNWSDVACVVIEASLYYCHQEQAKKFRVGEVARSASAILKGRGERTELEPKAIGAILRRLGLRPKRDSKGFAIRLDDKIRRHIHQLAYKFDVATSQDGAILCPYCTEIVVGETGDEGKVASTR